MTPPLPGSVVGPALTFRIRQNPQNFSLADVASQTGELGSVPLILFLAFPPSCGCPFLGTRERGLLPYIPLPLPELGR